MKLLKTHPLLSLLNSYLIDSPQSVSTYIFWNIFLYSIKILCLVIQIVLLALVIKLIYQDLTSIVYLDGDDVAADNIYKNVTVKASEGLLSNIDSSKPLDIEFTPAKTALWHPSTGAGMVTAGATSIIAGLLLKGVFVHKAVLTNGYPYSAGILAAVSGTGLTAIGYMLNQRINGGAHPFRSSGVIATIRQEGIIKSRFKTELDEGTLTKKDIQNIIESQGQGESANNHNFSASKIDWVQSPLESTDMPSFWDGLYFVDISSQNDYIAIISGIILLLFIGIINLNAIIGRVLLVKLLAKIKSLEIFSAKSLLGKTLTFLLNFLEKTKALLIGIGFIGGYMSIILSLYFLLLFLAKISLTV